jgi:predicted phosphodiesterase
MAFLKRVAAIYDIHANLPALEAVLREIRNEKIDHIVVGGDVLPGPMPRESLACLRNLGEMVQYIYGNGEVAVLQEMAGQKPEAVPTSFRPIVSWTSQQILHEHGLWLSSWPKTLTLEIDGLGAVLFCHATPRNENESFTRLTPESALLPVFENVDVPVVVCGHTHMQFDRRIARTRIVNAGSVGMPFGRPGADWILLGPDIQFKHTSYNLAAAAERVRITDYPQAQDFADHSILQPPSEEKMLEIFTASR